jgi:hypothetical protein
LLRIGTNFYFKDICSRGLDHHISIGDNGNHG